MGGPTAPPYDPEEPCSRGTDAEALNMLVSTEDGSKITLANEFERLFWLTTILVFHLLFYILDGDTTTFAGAVKNKFDDELLCRL